MILLSLISPVLAPMMPIITTFSAAVTAALASLSLMSRSVVVVRQALATTLPVAALHKKTDTTEVAEVVEVAVTTELRRSLCKLFTDSWSFGSNIPESDLGGALLKI